ncbi:energy-coupling factor ABC transporter ATP-binding protein [Isachenkonia alkalipeptolytica]|uniref:ATP-binding cassette domain-containing protein n=1 Tax=Isachenkonia alkalipeptolytica TaxID=2565777 RepID=A0AA44BE44_9CLOT|nr:ATP-binding cassette domain-containing protein [Isachenkonia alkalipeptolytica]NBG87101.1 ATP-binding cassette domain-containing protein [Isachenkonia alkalipeptolytica]
MEGISVSKMSYTYQGEQPALKNVSFNVTSGKKLAILGANGSGKSTLIQHFNGLILPQKGTVKIREDFVEKKNLKTLRQKVGIIFDQPDDQILASTVWEDVAFGPRNLRLAEEEVQHRVKKALKQMEIEELGEFSPYELSLGQKKKVAIAGVLAMKPEILVFDEPFSGLDPGSREGLKKALDTLHGRGHTLIFTTHNVDIAYQWADQLLILKEGQVLHSGGVEALENEDLLSKGNLELPGLVKLLQGTGIAGKDSAEINRTLKEALGIEK